MALEVKIAVAIFSIFGWIWSQKKIACYHLKYQGSSTDIQDHIHRLTERLNQYLNNNTKVANWVLIISSLFIDCIGLCLIFWGIFGDSIAPLVSLIFLFALRQISQITTTLPIPKGIIWRHPGFPSLLVTYNISNDLFFSGHTALAVLGGLEFSQLDSPLIATLISFVIFFEIATVLLLRAHWTIDVFTGILAALFIHSISKAVSPYVDQLLFYLS